MLRENLADAGEIVENILTEALSIRGIPVEVTLLESARRLDYADLKKILASMVENPEWTSLLMKELQLLGEDLHVH